MIPENHRRELSSGGASATLTWNSVASRSYYVQETSAWVPRSGRTAAWDLFRGRFFDRAQFQRHQRADAFYRVQAVRPLTP